MSKKYFVEPRDHGYGKEYSVYHGDESDHARGASDWLETVKTKKAAKSVIKEHQLSHWDNKK